MTNDQFIDQFKARVSQLLDQYLDDAAEHNDNDNHLAQYGSVDGMVKDFGIYLDALMDD
jgi:hypothetical protein